MSRARLLPLAAPLLLSLLLPACGGAGGDDAADDDATPTADADPFAPDADPLAPDAAPPGTPDAAPDSPYDFCVETCATAADCTPATTTPITDADNYACTGGRCVYKGCNSTAECTATFNSAGYACGTVTGNPLPACYPTCGTAADCATPSVPIYQADNYACDNGKCRWTGCNDSAECTQTFMNPSYTCAASGAGFDTCWPTCSTAADCANAASPLFDADNYDCVSGRCQWTGCNSTQECAAANGASWVCE